MVVTRSLVDAGVSSREAEVLEALGEHLTNAEIANRLFISVRTVESHVSSLLRKLGLSDRRELAQLAARSQGRATPDATAPPAPALGPAPGLPVPLTPFVGRVAERRALAAALAEDRLVTAVGPGGVGKTRLALAVAGDLVDRFADGVWYVDLVPVSDPVMIAPAVASTLGLGVPSARSAEDTVIESLAASPALVVLDNCEHLVAGVAVFVERLLARCPHLVVLATSRARLLVPFERVFPVPGLSLPPDGDEPGDAVALFLSRAAAVGSPVTGAEDRRRVGAICRALDGVALAIELAAARLPALGLDGLEVGLGDRLRLLAGGSRAHERHSSLRAALDWSYELLEPVDQAVLRRLAVFAAPFTVDAAAAVAGFPPVPEGKEPETVVDAIVRLADQSLVAVVPGRDGTRYRVLETIRQYGASQLDATGESEPTRQRHLGWCATVADELEGDQATADSRWRLAFDAVADDLRSGLGWAAERPERRAEAHAVALRLAGLTYRRGLLGEAQRRYEQAAALTDGVAAAEALRHAGGAAASRQAGEDALRLYQAAADAARAAGDDLHAARDLASIAMLAKRAPGIMTRLPPPVDVDAVLAEAQALAGDDLMARAVVAVSTVFDCEESDPASLPLTEEALELAQRVGDPLMESAALDQLTVVHLATGNPAAAVACTRRRLELLGDMPLDADSGFELHDAYHMAVETHIGFGDLRAARRFTQPLLRFPAYSEGHLGASRLVVADALAGAWDEVLAAAARFRANWERVGRPIVPYLALGVGAVAMVHGLRGDEAARGDWRAITAELRAAIERKRSGHDNSWAPTFDAIVLLHHGRFAEAVAQMAEDPAAFRRWHTGNWRQWYVALWVETAVLAGHPEAEARLARAGDIVAGNPIATAVVARADAWRRHDRAGLLAAAEALAAADCPYQEARTLVLAGGPDGARGAEMLAALGAAPMAVPDGSDTSGRQT